MFASLSRGFRAEHLQTEIEKSLYHQAAGHPALPRGEYQLSQHVGERCVYTFCMCPGGQVVASASEEGGALTNGMSYHARAGKMPRGGGGQCGWPGFRPEPGKVVFQVRGWTGGLCGGWWRIHSARRDRTKLFAGKGRLDLDRVQPTYDRGVRAFYLGSLLPEELAGTLLA